MRNNYKYDYSPLSSKEEAMRLWNDHAHKHTLSFERVAELAEGELTLEQLAQEGGITRERVRQLYKRFFSGWMPAGKRSAKEWVPERTERRREERFARAIEEVYALWKVRLLCGELGISFEPVPVAHSAGPSPNHATAVLNGRVCVLKVPTVPANTNPGARTRYWRATVSRNRVLNTEFTIIMPDDEERPDLAFVIPSEFLLEFLGSHRERCFIYIPTKRHRIYKNIRPFTDWLRFEGRWDLLEEGQG